MKKIIYFFILSIGLNALFGCSQVRETGKVLWGSSTRALEKARARGFRRSFRCTYEACFDSVMKMTHRQPLNTNPAPPGFKLFMQDRRQRYIVVMGVPGNVDTTEVGIFFDAEGEKAVRIEISSLSSLAAQTVADEVFAALGRDYGVIGETSSSGQDRHD